MPSDLERRIDGLFTAPPQAFVASRDALAVERKAAGDADGAKRVKALRRPTVAAWAVNQVARSSRREVAALGLIGDRLRDAHERLLAGGGDAAVREATKDRRRLVTELTDAAVARIGPGGDAQRSAISRTFDAAVSDRAAGLDVQAGRLTKELDTPAGFGGIAGVEGPAAVRAASPRRAERRAARQARGAPRAPAAERDDGDGQRQAQKGRARLTQLAGDADRLAGEAVQAAREAAAARQEVSRLQDLVVTANAKARAAAERARQAQWAAATAQQTLREASAPDGPPP